MHRPSVEAAVAPGRVSLGTTAAGVGAAAVAFA